MILGLGHTCRIVVTTTARCLRSRSVLGHVVYESVYVCVYLQKKKIFITVA